MRRHAYDDACFCVRCAEQRRSAMALLGHLRAALTDALAASAPTIGLARRVARAAQRRKAPLQPTRKKRRPRQRPA